MQETDNLVDSRIKVGNFMISAPGDHHLRTVLPVQAYRFLNLAKASEYLGYKYPEYVMVDVGANIGDTAAVMASNAANKLVLIEPCQIFWDYLDRNAGLFSNKVEIIHALISDGGPVCADLYVGHGNAIFQVNPKSSNRVSSIKLQDAIKDPCCLLKLDTEGFDVDIVMSSMAWIDSHKCAIFIENQVDSDADLLKARTMLSRLNHCGYRHFLVWDDAGVFMLGTDSLDALWDLARYIYVNACGRTARRVYYTDILCLHERDDDAYQVLRHFFLSC